MQSFLRSIEDGELDQYVAKSRVGVSLWRKVSSSAWTSNSVYFSPLLHWAIGYLAISAKIVRDISHCFPSSEFSQWK